jgi:hypothetical protein
MTPRHGHPNRLPRFNSGRGLQYLAETTPGILQLPQRIDDRHPDLNYRDFFGALVLLRATTLGVEGRA